MKESQIRAEEAKRLLENEVFNRALSDLRTLCYTNIEDSDPLERDVRENEYLKLKGLKMAENRLKSYIRLGSVETFNEEHMEFIR